MTNKQEELIFRLRQSGQGYRRISTAIGLSRDAVGNYCKLHGIDGYGTEIKVQFPAGIVSDDSCRQCGRQLSYSGNGRKRRYCSNECKKEWEKAYPKFYPHVCEYCWKEFQSVASQQKFCSHDCYIKSRFWRVEDLQGIIEKIMSGEQAIKVPKWFKDMVK